MKCSLLTWGIFTLLCLLPFLKIFIFLPIKRDPFEPIYFFIIYFYIGIGLRGLLLSSGLIDNHYGAPINNEVVVNLAYIYSIVAILSFYFGYYSYNKFLFIKKNNRIIKKNCDFLRLVISFIYGIIGFFSFWFFVKRYAYFLILEGSPAAVAALSHGGGIYWITMLAKFPLVGSYLTFQWKSFKAFLVFLLNIIAILLWFGIAGRKDLVIKLLLGLILIYQYTQRSLSLKKMLFLFFCFIILLPLLFYYREYGFNSIKYFELFTNESIFKIIEPFILRSYQFDMFTIIIEKIKSIEDLKYGGSLLELFYFFIPRAWWPNKPLTFGMQFGLEYLDPNIYYCTSYAPSFIGELYLNFHVIGIVVGFYILGFLLKYLYSKIMKSPNKINVIIYVIIVLEIIHLIEGPIAGHIIFLFADLLPILVYISLNKIFRSIKC